MAPLDMLDRNEQSTVAEQSPRRLLSVAILIDGDRYGEGAQTTKHGPFLDALQQHADVVGIGDMMLRGARRALCVACAWRPNPREWKAHYRANPLTFVTRSRQSRRWLAALHRAPRIVLQVGALSKPAKRGDLPFALYLDFTYALTRREWPARAPMISVERWLWHHLEMKTYAEARVIFCRSEHVARSLREDYGIASGKINVVGAGVNLPLPDLRQLPPRIEPRVLFIGSDFVRKGGDVLLRAWPEVRRRVPGAQLTIFGNTRSAALAGVTILPSLWDRSMVSQELAATSVFVMPSRCETWGDVFLEAMAYGLPCIGTTADAMPEIIEDGRTGFVVPAGDAAKLADCMVRLLLDAELRKEMGMAGRKRVERDYLWDPIVQRMVSILQEVSTGTPTAPRVDGSALGNACSPSQPLRVLQVIDSLNQGGAEQLLVTLARSIDKAAFNLSICSLAPLDESSHVVRQLRAVDVPLYTLGGVRLRNPLHALKLARLIRRLRIDVLHTHLGTANTIGSLAGVLAGCPVVSTLHNVHDIYPRYGAIKQRLQEQALRWCTHTIVACAPEVREVGLTKLHLPARKLVDVPNGIDTAAYNADPAAVAACRESLLGGLPGPLLIAVGNLRPAKGHHYLIDAAYRLRDRLPGLRVVIAGRGGRYLAHLRDQITSLHLEQHIILAGQRNDIAMLLRAADLFVQPSVLEGLPISVLEAMAANVPVVATAVGGVPRLVEDRKTGRLVPPADPAALAKAILDVLEDPSHARRMAAAAQDRVRSTYDAPIWAGRLQCIYEEATAGTRRATHDATT